ncbi:hypothetical protein OAB57_01335 [Bacteriovoracaceae bacterium]|nr:hypothetical protein [Bacteriovoracaceae bacterium]
MKKLLFVLLLTSSAFIQASALPLFTEHKANVVDVRTEITSNNQRFQMMNIKIFAKIVFSKHCPEKGFVARRISNHNYEVSTSNIVFDCFALYEPDHKWVLVDEIGILDIMPIITVNGISPR